MKNKILITLLALTYIIMMNSCDSNNARKDPNYIKSNRIIVKQFTTINLVCYKIIQVDSMEYLVVDNNAICKLK